MRTTGYAAYSPTSPLALFQFERRSLRSNDVAMEILHSGVCHSDLHTARNDWGWSYYPIVPGHEIVGRVTAVGADVRQYQVGDHVAVGCMVDSCMTCDQCRSGEEQLCRVGNTGTYAGRDRLTGENTQGGYSKHLVVREEFCLRVPPELDLARAAPLLCAGITTYSPLRTWNVGPGSRVGVIGLGGLGHMAVKLAVGLGADVTVISRSADNSPVRRGFMPTASSRRSEPGSTLAATRKNAAEEKSAGTATSVARSTWPPLSRACPGENSIGQENAASMRSV